MKRIASLILACMLLSPVLAADKPLDVRDLMTATQFHETGLDTLDARQLAAFNAWLAAYSRAPAAASAGAPAAAAAVPAPAPVTAANFGQEMLSPAARQEPDRIESRIVGTFTGWNGNSVFTLENGQVWKQADGSSYETRLENPPVVIKRLGFGYLLTLTGHGATVFVKRVK